MQRIEKLPIGFLATWLGFTTLSNIYTILGYKSLGFIAMYVGLFVLLMKLIKFIFFMKQCKEEYQNAVLASLYPIWGMLIMLIGSYFVKDNYAFGKTLWSIGFIFHAIFIVVFTIKHVFRNFNYHTFFPSWFVTYFGILVGTVTGTEMNIPKPLVDALMIYGFVLFPALYIPMIVRVRLHKIPDAFVHTKGIFMAPISLVIISYINFGYAEQNVLILKLLALALLLAIIAILSQTHMFFKHPFTPSFAGLTFPMAISTLAMIRLEQFFAGTYIAEIAHFVVGIMLFMTTSFIGSILFKFLGVVVVHPKHHESNTQK
ncbi:MAG: TDT family transporter [Brevinema sp.]